MRIISANNYHYIRGGSDKVFLETMSLLESAGHTTVPFSAVDSNNKESKFSRFFPTSVQEHPRAKDILRFIHNGNASRSLKDLLLCEEPFDLAHLHIYYGRLTTSILPVLKEAGIPIVQTLHEYKLACPVYTMERDGITCSACVDGSTLNLLINRCKDRSLVNSLAMYMEYWASRIKGDVKLIDRFLCISNFQLEVMKEAGIPNEKLTLQHNFVDTDAFKPVAADEKGRYLLYFGRIEKLKGVPTLIKAVKKTGHQLKIVGKGTWDSEMKREISGCQNIEYLDFLAGDALYETVAKAKAVVVPSEWYEPFGLTVIEAKASGVPVIASKIGGISELVRDGKDGFLFEAGNVDDLICAIGKLENSDSPLLAQQAREDAESRFSPAAHLSNLLGIYHDVISNS